MSDEPQYKPGGFIPGPQRYRIQPEDLPLIPLSEVDTSAVRAAADYGDREVTPEDRRRAVLHELANSRSNVQITEGMVRGLQQRRRRSWWRSFWRSGR